MDVAGQANKAHHKSSAGRKAKRKKEQSLKKRGIEQTNTQNFKAFTVANVGRLQRDQQRTVDRAHRKHVAPVHRVEQEGIDPPPVCVVVFGPKGVGKSTLIKGLVKRWTRQDLGSVEGPITVVSGKNRRLTLFECPSDDVNSMLDLSKVADLVLLLINAKKGIELSTFEMLNILQAHGMPKVIGVLTHLDQLSDLTKVKKAKKKIKARLWTETYDGAKLFYLSQLKNGKYLKTEVQNLGRFVCLAKFRPLTWKNSHSYFLADRVEDITSPSDIEKKEKCDRKVAFFGYLKGINLSFNPTVHICGVGDFAVDSVLQLGDPCPLGAKDSEQSERKKLNQKSTVLYAPMANVGSVVYDKDAVYIDLPSVHFTPKDQLLEDVNDADADSELEGVQLVKELQSDERKSGVKSQLQLFRSNSNGDTNSNKDDKSSASESDSEESGDEGSSASGWSSEEDGVRESIMRSAAKSFESRSLRDLDIMEKVYGKQGSKALENINDEVDDEDDDDENFFQAVGSSRKHENNGTKVNEPRLDFNQLDCLLPRHNAEQMLDWTNAEVCEMIRNRFVTGSWKPLEGDDENSEEASFEDLEDLESETDESKENVEEKEETIEETRLRLAKEKAEKKLAFDQEYDESKTKQEEEGDLKQIDLDDDYMKDKVEAIDKQKSLNKTEFQDLDPNQRAEYEGFRPGTYVRVVISGLSYEFIKYFSPSRPVLVGGINNNETGLSFIKARMKKHRWFPGQVLKTNDPLIFSFGWRRFQSVPLYFMEDQNMRQRMLKYTPEHIHCLALFQGPNTQLNTPFVCIQDKREHQKSFRIAATGICLELSSTSDVRKKLKLVGEPYKIHKNTCFVKNMFNSDLEVAKFEGARIQTVSGLRGIIKKAIKSKNEKSVDGQGSFRATFEDKVLKSDIIFCKTWVKLDPIDLFNPICNLLESCERQRQRSIDETLMKTVGQLRHEKGAIVPVNQDSLYKPIKRKNRVFNDIALPKSLEKSLPYSARPKVRRERDEKQKSTAWEDNLTGTRTVKVVSKDEMQIKDLLNKLNVLRKDKTAKQQKIKESKQELKRKRESKLLEKFESIKKADRKRRFRNMGLADKHRDK